MELKISPKFLRLLSTKGSQGWASTAGDKRKKYRKTNRGRRKCCGRWLLTEQNLTRSNVDQGWGWIVLQMARMALTHRLTTPGKMTSWAFLLRAPSLQDCAPRKSGNKHHFASSSPLQIQDFGTLGQIKAENEERLNSKWDRSQL